ncbi:GAF-like protein [Gracilaria domingensis]|nr:GAF-like protein [Gracilaria domingensis]
MPLAHALASDSAAFSPPALPFPNGLDSPECNPAISALTAASIPSTTASTVVRKGRITKKKSSTANSSTATDVVTAIGASLITQNLSSASDISSSPLPNVSSPDSNSVSTVADLKPTSSNAKSEPTISSPSKHPLQSSAQHARKPKLCKNESSPAPPKSHTRRCREKVTRQFENLLEVLPPPPRGVEVRHKAQILDYTINVFRSLLARRTSLQTHIALASNLSVRDWANSTLASASASLKADAYSEPLSISALLDPFMGFYCVRNSWTYAEAWISSTDSSHASLCSCVVNTENAVLSASLNAFASASKARYQNPSNILTGVVSRVRQTKRPEWLSELPSDVSVFDRASLARKQGVNVALAVPVVANNRCLAVILFTDVNSRPFSASAVDQLFEYTGILAECFVHHSRERLSPQQPVVAVSSDGQLVLNPGSSVDADSGLEPFGTSSSDIPAAHGWPSSAPLLVPQQSPGSSKSFFEETQLVRMKY